MIKNIEKFLKPIYIVEAFIILVSIFLTNFYLNRVFIPTVVVGIISAFLIYKNETGNRKFFVLKFILITFYVLILSHLAVEKFYYDYNEMLKIIVFIFSVYTIFLFKFLKEVTGISYIKLAVIILFILSLGFFDDGRWDLVTSLFALIFIIIKIMGFSDTSEELYQSIEKNFSHFSSKKVIKELLTNEEVSIAILYIIVFLTSSCNLKSKIYEFMGTNNEIIGLLNLGLFRTVVLIASYILLIFVIKVIDDLFN